MRSSNPLRVAQVAAARPSPLTPPALSDVADVIRRRAAQVNPHIRATVMERVGMSAADRIVIVVLQLGGQKVERAYPLCDKDDMRVLPSEVHEDACALCELVGRAYRDPPAGLA